MKKKILFTLPALLLLASCGLLGQGGGDPGNFNPFDPDSHNPIDDAGEHTSDSGIDDDVSSETEIEIKIPEEEEIEVVDTEQVSDITDLSLEGISYDATKKLFTITSGGEFIFEGEINGNILVDAGDEDEVKLTLNGFTIKSETDSPIKCVNASEFQLSIKSGTKNYVYDLRDTKTKDDDTQGAGAITSFCDMKLSGKGSLFVTAKYNNGIHCKDDLKIQPEVKSDSSIQIQAYNNCLKGNDSVTIESGNFVLISTNGNGIITENTDLSSKGKQRGSITITGGHLDIYSAKDAIDAAYNAEIGAEEEANAPIINIYTSNFSSYSGEVSDTSDSKMYLRLSSNANTSSYYYAVEFLNSDYTTTWKKASVDSTTRTYKYLAVDKPSKATSLKVVCFASSVTEMSEANAYAIMSDYSSLSNYYDTARISVSSYGITLDGWTSYQTTQPGGRPGGQQPGGMSEGNDDKAEVSAKGIKADNIINITNGIFFIKTYDDAIHANYGTTFETNETGVGDVNISGGTFSIYASDDGIHADHSLNISGGTIDIEYSYEGIEGNLINFSGGYTKVYSVDDGLNAANKSNVTPAIKVSGGIVDVTVYGQDVDGIDSNGSFTQTGGYVITKAGNSQMSTGLDVDGSAAINGGTFIAFGRTEKTPSKGSGVSSYTLSGSYSIGKYNVALPESDTITVVTKYSYSSITVYSNLSTKVTVTKA